MFLSVIIIIVLYSKHKSVFYTDCKQMVLFNITILNIDHVRERKVFQKIIEKKKKPFLYEVKCLYYVIFGLYTILNYRIQKKKKTC